MATNDGGPAFPNEGILETSPHAGMNGRSLRDYMAAKAMQELVIQYMTGRMSVREVADNAYMVADAMLSAREAKP